MPIGQKKIVLIEDDREITSTLVTVLEGAGYRVSTASNGIDGQRLIQNEAPALVITDMMMPRMGGFPVLEFLKTLDNPPKVIMITANEGGRHKAYAEMLGAVDYLRKPFAMDVLLEAVRRATTESDDSDDADEKKGPLKRRVTRKKADD
jgi:DNA-binding response OmpR family regulator